MWEGPRNGGKGKRKQSKRRERNGYTIYRGRYLYERHGRQGVLFRISGVQQNMEHRPTSCSKSNPRISPKKNIVVILLLKGTAATTPTSHTELPTHLQNFQFAGWILRPTPATHEIYPKLQIFRECCIMRTSKTKERAVQTMKIRLQHGYTSYIVAWVHIIHCRL